MDLGPHAAFIIAAYIAAIVVLGSLIVWVLVDYRAQLRKLAILEEHGMTRRSDKATPAS